MTTQARSRPGTARLRRWAALPRMGSVTGDPGAQDMVEEGCLSSILLAVAAGLAAAVSLRRGRS